MSAHRNAEGRLALGCETFGCHAEIVASPAMGVTNLRQHATDLGWVRKMLHTGTGFRHFDLCPEHKELTA
jgi:hypothetical protein